MRWVHDGHRSIRLKSTLLLDDWVQLTLTERGNRTFSIDFERHGKLVNEEIGYEPEEWRWVEIVIETPDYGW